MLYSSMLNRIACVQTLRPMRPMFPLIKQTRLYSAVGGDDPAEFKARKGTSDSTLVIAGVSTFFIITMYAIMTGTPKKAADMTTKSDPEAVAHMKPPNPGGK